MEKRCDKPRKTPTSVAISFINSLVNLHSLDYSPWKLINFFRNSLLRSSHSWSIYSNMIHQWINKENSIYYQTYLLQLILKWRVIKTFFYLVPPQYFNSQRLITIKAAVKAARVEEKIWFRYIVWIEKNIVDTICLQNNQLSR